MILSYSKWADTDKDRIRSIEAKPHVGYIRYLLCRRTPFEEIPKELVKLGFSPVRTDDLYFYFREVLFPVFQSKKIHRYYFYYKPGRECDLLSFQYTFGHAEDDRQSFCVCAQMFEIEFFFANEILNYYQTTGMPLLHDTGEPILKIERTNAMTEVLQHPKRHIIEVMLSDGKTPKQISAYLHKTFGLELSFKDIQHYANAFFKLRRRDLTRTIDDLQDEKSQLEVVLEQIKSSDELSLSEKHIALGETKKKITDLEHIIKRMQGHHTHNAYHAGVLEYANIREIFSDVMLRSHKRFVDIDESQPETDAVNYLSVVVNMMSKATEKIIAVDDKMSETTKKSVSDEMLEVVLPTIERVNQEERDAAKQMDYTYHEGNIDILGDDD